MNAKHTMNDNLSASMYSAEVVDQAVRDGRRLRALAVRDAFGKVRTLLGTR